MICNQLQGMTVEPISRNTLSHTNISHVAAGARAQDPRYAKISPHSSSTG